MGADDDALDARGDAEGGVTNVAGLLTEDRAQQLLLRGQLSLAFGRGDFTDEDVVGLHLGADADDAGLVEVLEGFFTDVRDVAGDLFLAQLGIAGDAFEFLDVHRGEEVPLGQPLGDQDGVLEVVTLPGHEGDEDVFAEGELTLLGRRTVGDDVTGVHRIAGSTMGFWLKQVLWFERWNFTRL